MTNKDKYAVKIISQLQGLFEEECENHIGRNELMIGNNAIDFMHALANIAPAMIAHEISGNKMNLLEFNHMANQLCFQYMIKDGNDENT